MRAVGLRGRKKHASQPRTTDSRHTQPVAPNLIAERPAPTGPNQCWLTDITYLKTAEGWLYLAAILDSTARLGTLIDNVLDLTQSDAGALPIERKRIDLAALLQEAADARAAGAQEKAIDLVVEVDVSVGTIKGDRKRVLQAVDQLLLNAITYTETGGRVLLHGSGTTELATLVVSGKAGRKLAFKAVNRVEWFCFRDLALGQGLAYEDWIRLLAEQRLGSAEPASNDFAELERLAGARILEVIGETGRAF